MKLIRNIILVIVVGVIIAVSFRYVRHQRDRSLALPVVAALGGKAGSISMEPLGTEYFISFRNRTFTRSELDRLAAIEPLASRNYVKLHLEGVDMTPEDVAYLKQRLPSVRLFHSAAEP